MAWERRWHPLREEWVTITSHRNHRPWAGSTADVMEETVPEYVEDCHLCPGNQRITGERNENYHSVFVFDNDHPSFSKQPGPLLEAPPFFEQATAYGLCRVVCYSPLHNISLAEMSVQQLLEVLQIWSNQTTELMTDEDINNVFIFENKGEVVGVSNPHPHAQVYGTGFVLKTIELEVAACAQYNEKHQRNLFDDLMAAELEDSRRMLVDNSQCMAFIPYFARFPYETYIVPKSEVQFICQLDSEALLALAKTLHEVLVRYDNLWQSSFPYILTLHQAPCDGEDHDTYRFHIQIHPPLRQQGLQKFLAGIETGGGTFLNDGCPEEKAAELKAVSELHYKAGMT